MRAAEDGLSAASSDEVSGMQASGKVKPGKESGREPSLPEGKPGREEQRRLRPPGAKSVGWALVQAARLHRSRIGDRLAALDLFAGQEQVVQALAAAGTMTMGDLAATLRVRPPTASKTISRLAALGFVERRAEAGDGRIVRVRLTETGLARAAAIERLWDEVEAELLDGFDNKERRRLRKLLRKVARNLADVTGAAGHEAEAELDGEEEDEAGLIAPDAVIRPL
ncbi:MarR family winged helix-turn-helix transcriptional regulator [Methylobacterium segetis]|uniref:MarR family winged helix-turn-helix transcriptional regulator n=1 Tax=Methylobacterium segetis TaxID=2488750 RepID=UPI001A9DA35C|nr:MarR family winged helix-turn-helix transcriptional regulator [Methylobacterium segetis]